MPGPFNFLLHDVAGNDANITLVNILRSTRLTGALFLCLALVACGGGGGGGGNTTPPTTGSDTLGTIEFSIGGPSATIQARRPNFVPPSVGWIDAKLLNSSSQVSSESRATCAQSQQPCQVTFKASAGAYTLDILAISTSGQAISHVALPVTVSSGQTTTVKGTLNGIIAWVKVSMPSPVVMNGSASTSRLLVTAYDAVNEVIMSPGQFDQPVKLNVVHTNAGASSGLTLSETTVVGPSDVVTVAYDGKSYDSLRVTANYNDPVSGTNAWYIVAPQLNASEYAMPSGQKMTASIINGPDGNVWAGTDLSLARVTPGGQVSEYCANPGPTDMFSAPDGTIWFGRDEGHMPGPNASYTCAASSAGLRSITTSGVQNAMNVPQFSGGDFLTGPRVAPDGTIWISTAGDLIQLDAAGNEVSQVQPTLNGSYAANRWMPGLASDSSFWYPFVPGIIVCPRASNTCAGPTSVGQFFTPQQIISGPPGEMILTDNANSVYDVDLSFSVKWSASNLLWVTFTGPPSYFKGAVWIGTSSSFDGHPQLLHIERGGNYAFLLLPQVQGGANTFQTPSVSGLLLGNDGKLWYTRDTYVGSAPIQ